MTDDLWFERLVERDVAAADEPAPAMLKSRVYSALVSRMADSGPLLDVSASQQEGQRLCVFEHTLALVPVEAVRSMNPCRICHARVLGERLSHAPIFWPGCPYSDFHNG